MAGFFMGMIYKGAEAFILVLAGAVSLFGGGRSIVVTPAAPQTALVARAYRALPEGAAASAIVPPPPTSTTEKIIPGLLPQVALKSNSAHAPASSERAAAKNLARPVSLPASPPAPVPLLTTADELLSHATTTITRRGDGSFALSFRAVSGNSTLLSWQYGATSVGGSGGIPRFSAKYSCDPPPGPYFAVRTNYNCTVSLTPVAGTDRRTRSKSFSFATGPGELRASPPANMNTHLTNDQNDGGFVFLNNDTKPVSVLSETFDISYVGIGTMYGPLVLRLVDPNDATHYVEYHMEQIPAADPSSPTSTHRIAGVTLSLPFTVNAASDKMLPIEVLGVHKLSIAGTNPTITITLRGATTDRNDIVTNLGTPKISWSCVVALGYYDPNATSGPFATGEACQN